MYGMNSSSKEEDSSDEDDLILASQTRKPRGKNEFTESDRLVSTFYIKYLLPASIAGDRDSGIWDTSCREGSVFRRRFRIPFIIFDAIVHEISQIDSRCASDAAGVKSISTSSNMF